MKAQVAGSLEISWCTDQLLPERCYMGLLAHEVMMLWYMNRLFILILLCLMSTVDIGFWCSVLFWPSNLQSTLLTGTSLPILGNLPLCIVLGIHGHLRKLKGSDFYLPHPVPRWSGCRCDLGFDSQSPQDFEFWADDTVLARGQLIVVLRPWLWRGWVFCTAPNGWTTSLLPQLCCPASWNIPDTHSLRADLLASWKLSEAPIFQDNLALF